jgi:hypothetical protein
MSFGTFWIGAGDAPHKGGTYGGGFDIWADSDQGHAFRSRRVAKISESFRWDHSSGGGGVQSFMFGSFGIEFDALGG